MRRTFLVGAALVMAVVVTAVLSGLLDLDLDAALLLGVVSGAVVALIPDATPVRRLIGFGVGVVIGLVGFVVRAALLPDSTTGRTLAVVVAVVLCVGLSAATINRIPLWAPLLGAAVWSGIYEYAYDVAPPELPDTSLTALTTLVLAAAAGFAATVLAAPGAPADRTAATADPHHAHDTDFDSILEGQR